MGAPYKPLKIYKASAGSGKTYALAKEYVKILIRNPLAYRQILAITFTKKATAEMKNRILRFLRELKNGQNDDLKQALISEIKNEHNFNPEAALEKHAADALNHILHDYSHFQVTTIDSFFQHVIRSFAKELNLPIGMTVELDTEWVLEKCVDALMEDYEKSDTQLSRWLEDFVFSKMEDAKSWKIEKNLLEMSRELLKEQYMELHASEQERPAMDSYDLLLKQLKKTVKLYQDNLLHKVAAIQEGIENNNIEISVFSGNKTIPSFLKKIAEFDFDEMKTIRKMLSGEQAVISKAKQKENPPEAARSENYWNEVLKYQVSEIFDYHALNNEAYQTAKHILRHLYSLALMDILADKLKNYRDTENTLLISDANHIIGKIAAEEASPFIFEKAGTFLKYLLIDEFQDTSQMQWSGLLPMVLETVAQGTGMTLIVGDPKQSIYRWRGGKMELLLKEIDKDLRHFRELKMEIPLNSNYRSAPEIINFNNAFFEALKNNGEHSIELFQLAYKEHEQKIFNTGLKGYVECRWLPQAKEPEDLMLTEMLKILREAGSRREWKDICILVRRNSEGVEIANYLNSAAPEIPFVSGESLLVNSALSVKLLIAAIEYIMNPLQEFYRYKFDYLLTQFFGLAKPEEALVAKTKFAFQEYFEENKVDLAALQKLTIDELLSAVMRLLNLDVEADAYILRLQDIVFDFVRDKELSVAAFLEHWEEQKDKYAILPPDGMNAVTISTVHKAKGLEYPVVIMPYLDWSVAPKSNSIFWGSADVAQQFGIKHFPLAYQKSLMETAFARDYQKETELGYIDIINVLYVAFTRPQSELYVLCTDKMKDGQNQKASEKELSSVLKTILQKLELPNAVFENNRFIFGKIPQSAKKGESIKPQNLIPPKLKDFKSEFKLKQNEIWNERVWKGDILHEILALAETFGAIHKSAQTIGIKYGLSVAEMEAYVKEVETVFQIFQKNNWGESKYNLLNEHALFFEGEELRPDKVLYSDEDCIIVDYKTGKEKPKHKDQLKKYKKAYAELLKLPVKAYLLYTHDMKLLEI